MSTRSAVIDVHPTADVHPSATLGDGVVVEASAHIGPRCVIGANTRIRRGAVVVSHTTMGERNDVHSYAVLGGDPQDRAFKPDVPGALIIGDGNIFREHATISRSTGEERPTRIGSNCFLMAYAHVGHNSVLEDDVVMVNGASVAGHCSVGRGALLSAGSGLHQFCRMGELVMLRGLTGVSMHAPPFVIVADTNKMMGLNVIGMRRCGRYTAQDRLDVKRAFMTLYRGALGRPIVERLAETEALGLGAAGQMFLAFIRATLSDEPPRRRGVVGPMWSRRLIGSRTYTDDAAND
ncbi:MAG: acyl-ACP--UDP-N-acetylglucosamine O-acyltransferase [Phycisphaerales bacterium]|nr:MAG: acyl-ACP--UDP-N-acetylglucosamine O-acyltransferase [Phycisphaerales bacterium]